MYTLLRRFLRDESGSVVVGDWVFVATILVLGAVAGAAALRPAPDAAEDSPAAVAVHAPAHADAAPAGATDRP